MKKSFSKLCRTINLLMLLLLAGTASAQETLPAEVEALFTHAFPTYRFVLVDQCRATAVAVMRDEEEQALCLAGKKSNEWRLIVANSAALDQDKVVSSLYLDTDDALATMDTSEWAVVNNPNPADRLHLREKPERSAKSLGKYFNGTLVRILETKGDWVHVELFDIQGWMMKRYLVFGAAAHAVEAVFPSRMPVESKRDHYLYAVPYADEPIENFQTIEQSMVVLGIVGDEWYHAWFPSTDQTGYVPQSDWWEGNG